MKCFNHQDMDAVGTCKHCNKGLCNTCSTDLSFGLACKNSHEKQVEQVNMVIEKNIMMYSKASTNSLIMPIFYIFMGLVFSGFGYNRYESLLNLTGILGIGFIVFGVIIFLKNREIFNHKKSA